MGNERKRGAEGKTGAEVDPQILEAIKLAVKEEIQPLAKKLDDIAADLKGVLERTSKLEERVNHIEPGLQDCSDRVESLRINSLPAIADHIALIAEQLAHQTLKIDAHRRKWNLIVHGIDGAPMEDEKTTRRECLKFAKDTLKVTDAETHGMAACHRLSKKKDAGIIIRFVDLAHRDKWLTGTSHLKNSNKNVTVSVDLPPPIRPLKDQLMKSRKATDAETKRNTRLKHLSVWPFVELQTKDRPPQRPEMTLRDITPSVLGVNHVMTLETND